MALISTKNLVAPLTNKVHLTSLVLLAVAFAVLRFAGGSISVEKTASGRIVRPAETEEAHTEKTRRGVEALHSGIPRPWDTQAKPAEKPRQTPPPQKGGLADIEKSLGL